MGACLNVADNGLTSGFNMNVFDGDFLLALAAMLVEGCNLRGENCQQFGCLP